MHNLNEEVKRIEEGYGLRVFTITEYPINNIKLCLNYFTVYRVLVGPCLITIRCYVRARKRERENARLSIFVI